MGSSTTIRTLWIGKREATESIGRRPVTGPRSSHDPWDFEQVYGAVHDFVRLRKYLARFGLDWARIQDRTAG